MLDVRNVVKVIQAARVDKAMSVSMEAHVNIFVRDDGDRRALQELQGCENDVKELS